MSSEAETTSAVATPVTPTKATAPGSAISTPSKETDEAMNQLVQGKRHLLVKDYVLAVTCLGKACELLAVRFGETAPECGDAYLNYGKALLELARTESGVVELNESEKGDEDDGDEEEEEEEGDDAEGETADGEDSAEKQTEEKELDGEKTNGDAEKPSEVKNGEVKESPVKSNGDAHNGEGEKDAKENGEKDAKENGEKDAKENGAKEGEEGEKLEDDEDVNNLQLSWEMLELAKVVFQKQLETKEDKVTALKLSEVYLNLGEVAVESENYACAVDDMKTCLELQKQHLDDDDRRIAQTLYTMGMAYSLSNEFEPAIEQFKAASDQIEKRIAKLEALKGKEPEEKEKEGRDAFYTVQGEIDELKALLPEMKEKISDMRDFKTETLRRMMEKVAEDSAKKSSSADGAGPSSVQDKPVSSVMHLVKRKPKEEVQVKDEVKKDEGESEPMEVDMQEPKEASLKKEDSKTAGSEKKEETKEVTPKVEDKKEETPKSEETKVAIPKKEEGKEVTATKDENKEATPKEEKEATPKKEQNEAIPKEEKQKEVASKKEEQKQETPKEEEQKQEIPKGEEKKEATVQKEEQKEATLKKEESNEAIPKKEGNNEAAPKPEENKKATPKEEEKMESVSVEEAESTNGENASDRKRKQDGAHEDSDSQKKAKVDEN